MSRCTIRHRWIAGLRRGPFSASRCPEHTQIALLSRARFLRHRGYPSPEELKSTLFPLGSDRALSRGAHGEVVLGHAVENHHGDGSLVQQPDRQ